VRAVNSRLSIFAPLIEGEGSKNVLVPSTPEFAELAERDRAILNAIIERHILTAEPVSSSQLCAFFTFGYSSATVRNIMARLEEIGFLSHPYTSAGKVPTVKAYRYFVDRILNSPGMETTDRQSLRPELLEQVRAVDQVIKLTAGVLAAVSQLLAVSWVSSRGDERLARIELARLSSRKILLVILTDSRDEIHHILETSETISREQLARVSALVNEHGCGLTAAELNALARAEWPNADRQLADLLRRALEAIGASLTVPVREEMAVEGTGNLISQPEFNNISVVRRLVSMLDRREELLHSFEAPGIECNGLRVVIGEADPRTGLPPLSFITVGVSLRGGQSARLGVIGPTRMAYGRVISLLGSTATTVSQILACPSRPGRSGGAS